MSRHNDEHTIAEIAETLYYACLKTGEFIRELRTLTESSDEELQESPPDDPARREILDDWWDSYHNETGNEILDMVWMQWFGLQETVADCASAMLGLDRNGKDPDTESEWISTAIRDDWDVVGLLDVTSEFRSVFLSPNITPDLISRAAQDVTVLILEYLAEFTNYDAPWVACIPLERRFQQFPEFTDFGPFAIINTRAGAPGAHRSDEADDADARELQRLLANHMGVNFMTRFETEDSYLRCAKQIYKDSQGYIPGSPQLAVRMKPGPEAWMNHRLKKRLHELLPLLRLCQLACDFCDEATQDSDLVVDGHAYSGSPATTPDGRPVPHGVIEILPWALAINTRNGTVATWFRKAPTTYRGRFIGGHFIEPPRLGITDKEYQRHNVWYDEYLYPVLAPLYRHPERIFESTLAPSFDAALFKLMWDRVATPLLDLRVAARSADGGGVRKMVNAIDAGVLLMSSSVYGLGGNIVLNAVIASEALLNPFDDRSNLKHRFVRVSSGLRAYEAHVRQQKYSEADILYRYRCEVAHRGDLAGGKINKNLVPQQLVQPAVSLFVEVVVPVVEWATTRVRLEQSLNEKAWDQFCRPFLLYTAEWESGAGI